MPLTNITIKIKNLDEEGLERVKEFVIGELEDAGIQFDIVETEAN